MNFFNKILRKKTDISLLYNYLTYLNTIENDTQTDTTAYSAIDRISTTIAGIGIDIYKKNNHQKVKNHCLVDLFEKPNAEETHSTFFTQIVKDYYSGNIFLFVSRDSEGNTISLIRLNPSSVRVERDRETFNKIYYVGGKKYTNKEILHIPSRFGYDGLTGKSIFDECRSTFETSKTLNAATISSFGSLGKKAVIDISNSNEELTVDQQKNLAKLFQTKFAGVSNYSTPLIKTKEVSYEYIDNGIKPSEELSINKNYQSRQIAEIFGVPEAILNGSNYELENTTALFLANSIKPICKVLEESFNTLFSESDKYKYYVEFNYDTLLQTTIINKFNALTQQVNNGLISVNEARRALNKPPVDGGDTLYRNSGLQPIDPEITNAYMAKSKIAMAESEINTPIEDAEKAQTMVGVGSEKI